MDRQMTGWRYRWVDKTDQLIDRQVVIIDGWINRKILLDNKDRYDMIDK